MARCTGWWLAGVASFMASCVSTGGDDAGEQYAGANPQIHDDGGGDGTGSSDGGSEGGDAGGDDVGEGIRLATGCPAYGSDVYTPFESYGPVSSGDVADYPWRGVTSTYPDSIEDFRAYGPALPDEVECGSGKDARDHLDVTAGCLTAVSADGDKAGQIHGTTNGYYRSFALPYDAEAERQVAWTDQGVEYRFKYSEWTGNISNPGFKAFARYLTEYDLYVASWRRDGVVQIQKKQCGTYTTLKRDPTYGAPSPNVWHTIRFDVVGHELRLSLDGSLVMTTTDDSIEHGTAGIRIDSAEGALIDDWRVYAP